MARQAKNRNSLVWEEWSLTTKLLTIMMTLMLLVLTGTSAWVLENLRGSLIERTDQRLIQASEALAIQAAEAVAAPSPLQKASSSQSEESLRQLLPGNYYVQFYAADGSKLYDPVVPYPKNTPFLPPINAEEVTALRGDPFTVGGTGSQWRARALKVKNSDLFVAIAVPFDRDIDDISEHARNTMIGIGLLALALVAGIGYLAITNTFRPLREIENTASRIAAGDLSQRVSNFPRNTEVGRLSSALNTMLGKIEDSFDGQTRSEKRIRQFVSDASHELRTPLVTIRGYAELYRQGAITKESDVRQAMDRIEAEAKRMGVLVEDLVMLARMDESRPAELGPVDIAQIVRDAAADAAAQAPDRDISLANLDGEDVGEVPTVLGSEAKIRQVIVNLAGNAVRHTPDATAIEFRVGTVDVPVPAEVAPVAEAKKGRDFVTGPVNIFRRNTAGAKAANGEKLTGNGKDSAAAKGQATHEVDTQSTTGELGRPITPDISATGTATLDKHLREFPYGRVRFEVQDHGDGIDPEQVPRIFERFYRLDSSRNRDTGGSGLGLSIVKAIVDSHGGEISVHPTRGGGATFRVDLPIPEPPQAAPGQTEARKDDS